MKQFDKFTMKRPKVLYIEPFTFTVESRDEWSQATGNMGNCLNDTQQIIVDAGLTEQAERDTVLHEALHGIIGQTTFQKRWTEEEQEEVCWTLTPRLLALLKDNPDFVTWLAGR